MQQMQQMMQMQMMAQMMGAFGGGTSSDEKDGGGSGTGFDMMQMMRLMSGMADTRTVPIFRDAVAFGTMTVGGQEQFGGLGLRILPPTPELPRASLELISGSQRIELLPNEIVAVKSWFNDYPEKKVVGMMPDGREIDGTVMELLQEAHTLDEAAKAEADLNSLMVGV